MVGETLEQLRCNSIFDRTSRNINSGFTQLGNTDKTSVMPILTSLKVWWYLQSVCSCLKNGICTVTSVFIS